MSYTDFSAECDAVLLSPSLQAVHDNASESPALTSFTSGAPVETAEAEPPRPLKRLRRTIERPVPTVGQVHCIIDKETRVDTRTGNSVVWYLVQWADDSDGQRHQDSWLSSESLLADGFRDECALVDRWKASGSADFVEYCASDAFGKTLRAGPGDHCCYVAVEQAMNALSKCNWVKPELIAAFEKYCADTGVVLPSAGLTIQNLRRFIVFGNKHHKSDQILMKVYDRNLIHGSIRGKTSAAQLGQLALEDGVYLCGAYNSTHLGHTFVVINKGGWKVVVDGDDALDELETYGHWIFGVYFLRRVVLA
jgi:hypothetical protein